MILGLGRSWLHIHDEFPSHTHWLDGRPQIPPKGIIDNKHIPLSSLEDSLSDTLRSTVVGHNKDENYSTCRQLDRLRYPKLPVNSKLAFYLRIL